MTEFVEIPLTKGYVAIVDAEDYESVSAYKWTADVREKYVYARRNASGKKVYLHRELLCEPRSTVDHVNGNTLDNRRSNLRAASNRDNVRNARKRSDSTLPFKGIQKNGPKRWCAFIRVDGDRLYLGTFDSPECAAAAYDQAAREHFGEFARTNFGLGDQHV